jgi:hypothetical protein
MNARYPNFIVIGAMKCGTSTLHTQLARQPNVEMSTLKEPNFFSNDEQWARGQDWYLKQFENANEAALVGESSTHYTKLPTYPKTIERLHSTLGNDLKFVYIIRDPIERLISHYIHEWTMGMMSEPLNEAIDKYPELIAYSCYGMQIKPYVETFGPDNILITSFEFMTHDPQAFLAEIGMFLGSQISWTWDDSIEAQNVSKDRLRETPLLKSIKSSPTLTWLRRTLLSDGIRAKLKQRYQMRERPSFNIQQKKILLRCFNEDLKKIKSIYDSDRFRISS